LSMAWRWRLAVLLAVALTAASTRGWWLAWIGEGLVCAETAASGEVVLLENFDPDYRLFERAATLQRGGFLTKVLVPTPTASNDSTEANLVSRETVELMARLARVQNLEIVPIQEIEPYSLNAARQIRDRLVRQHVRSVLVLSPAFRSKRSSLVYQTVLRPVG